MWLRRSGAESERNLWIRAMGLFVAQGAPKNLSQSGHALSDPATNLATRWLGTSRSLETRLGHVLNKRWPPDVRSAAYAEERMVSQVADGPVARPAVDVRYKPNRRPLLPESPLAVRRCQSDGIFGTGQAIRRDVDGITSRTPPLSRNQLCWQFARWAHRWLPAGTPLPPCGVRPYNGAWTGRRAW